MICAGLDQGGIDTCQGDSGDRWCVKAVEATIYKAPPAGVMGVPALESLAFDISKLSQISLALRLVKLRITILKYHSWYLCQISLQIMLLPIQIL